MKARRAYIVCYDVADRKRLRRVAGLMEQNGVRIQRSVFVCRLTAGQHRALVAALGRRIDAEADAVSVYPLCERCEQAAEHLGIAFAAPPVPPVLVL